MWNKAYVVSVLAFCVTLVYDKACRLTFMSDSKKPEVKGYSSTCGRLSPAISIARLRERQLFPIKPGVSLGVRVARCVLF